ncbi:sensor histidine kinase [Hoyosella altamirensis]|uniref:histidine kinase n=1 Tax=Hoyosella altamirensis TaxID=616997 RepID=A0A839RHK2_9ACTN|nr:sensor histidine kinase [Hoyosella altamirensis]MBB3035613.1 signal transduction histidine kinase [Hoyosella altamirensis]
MAGPSVPAAGKAADGSFVSRWFAWSRRNAMRIDVGIAIFVSLFGLLGVLATADRLLELVLALGMTVPLAWRRRNPEISGFTVAVFAYASLALIGEPRPAAVGVLFAAYGLAAYGSTLAARAGIVAGALGMGIMGVLNTYEGAPMQARIANVVFAVILITVVWTFGMIRRFRINEVAGLTERARLLELEREQEMKLAAVEERTRIAREMHDIVAHSLTVVIAQADGGRYAGATNPDAAVDALSQISSTGRQALTDMRALLAVLREGDSRDLASAPGIDDIPPLLEDYRRSGVSTTLRVTGSPREISTGAALTAYRIVQESLTNVLKHVGPMATAEVRLSWGESELTVTITDDGRGLAGILPKPEAPGQGVLGMKERAQLYGGSVSAGPGEGGGYEVRASLPYRLAS